MLASASFCEEKFRLSFLRWKEEKDEAKVKKEESGRGKWNANEIH